MTRLVLLLFGVLLLSAPVQAQAACGPVPTGVVVLGPTSTLDFNPPAEHTTLLVPSNPTSWLITSYRIKAYARSDAGAISSLQMFDIGRPAVVNGCIGPIPIGTLLNLKAAVEYFIRAYAVWSGGEAASGNSNFFVPPVGAPSAPTLPAVRQ